MFFHLYSAKSWWKYAISVHLGEIQERNKRLTKTYLSRRAHDVVKYTTTYRNELMKLYIDVDSKVMETRCKKTDLVSGRFQHNPVYAATENRCLKFQIKKEEAFNINLWKRCIRKTVNQRGLIGKM